VGQRLAGHDLVETGPVPELEIIIQADDLDLGLKPRFLAEREADQDAALGVDFGLRPLKVGLAQELLDVGIRIAGPVIRGLGHTLPDGEGKNLDEIVLQGRDEKAFAVFLFDGGTELFRDLDPAAVVEFRLVTAYQ
jgi:hypothetical protein